MHFHVHLVAGLEVREVHQRRIENQAVRVANFGNGLNHGVKLCFTRAIVKRVGNCKGERQKGKMAQRLGTDKNCAGQSWETGKWGSGIRARGRGGGGGGGGGRGRRRGGWVMA